MKLKIVALVFLGSASTVFAASTLSLRNFSSTTVGVPIVDSAGAAVDQTTIFANGGYFSTPLNFGTATFTDIRNAFVSIDSSPLTGGTRSGLFTGQTFDGTLPVGFAGKDAYIVVGNNTNFAAATAFAVFNAGTTFVAPDQFGNSAQTLSGTTVGTVVFGTVRSVTTQPTGLNSPAFASGVVLAIPEPSAALLGAFGALGLLRRRRN